MALRSLFGLVFGPGRGVVARTLDVVQQTAELGTDGGREAALSRLAAEFSHPDQTRFNRIIDGLNRLPRPLMAYGVLGFFAAAVVSPDWFARRMEVLILVPEPLWWLMGAIISLYFGARYQSQSQAFQRSIAETIARAPEVVRSLSALEVQAGDADDSQLGQGDNPALADWQARRAA